MAKVLIPIPVQDFDPTEVAVSWKVLVNAGHTVCFATPTGTPGAADDCMITGEGLDIWGWAPGLRRMTAVGRILRADANGRSAYAEMISSAEFAHPIRWEQIDRDEVDGLLIAGGHRARGMRGYLESELLQALIVEAFRRDLPLAAVCHGVLLAARSADPDTGRSVLYGRRTTSLTWAQERLAANIGRIVRFWDPTYYRTYPDGPGRPAGYMSVQSEVTRALRSPDDFIDVDPDDPNARVKNDGRHRDSISDERPAHVVQDGNYISARWPGDVHTFANRFAALLTGAQARPPESGQPFAGQPSPRS